MALQPIDQTKFKMRLISDLGMQKPTENYSKKVRMAIFECTYCKQPFSTVVSTKAQNQLLCKQCNGKQNAKPLRNTRLYSIWATTKNKVIAINSHKSTYLDRNITFCSEWDEFDNFAAWALANGYRDDLTIDRIDNDGNYTPDNCRWVSYSVQVSNTRKLRSNNTSGYRGVVSIAENRHVATIRYENIRFTIGVFTDVITAAKAYDSFVTLLVWPHTTNGLLTVNEVVLPTTKKAISYLETKGIHISNYMSKEP